MKCYCFRKNNRLTDYLNYQNMFMGNVRNLFKVKVGEIPHS